MIWVFPEYGGQIAVTIGKMKAVRQGLKTKKPGAWEVYDLSSDVSESKDVSTDQVAFIAQVEELLSREVSTNTIFPLEFKPQ